MALAHGWGALLSAWQPLLPRMAAACRSPTCRRAMLLPAKPRARLRLHASPASQTPLSELFLLASMVRSSPEAIHGEDKRYDDMWDLTVILY